MLAKKEYSDHFDFNTMRKFNLNLSVCLKLLPFDTKRFEAFARKKIKTIRIVRKTNIITSIILMFIFLRKRLLCAYLTE